jgi:hypothetical protein
VSVYFIMKLDSAEELRRLVRHGGFALPVTLPQQIVGRASLLASRRSSSAESIIEIPETLMHVTGQPPFALPTNLTSNLEFTTKVH